MAPALLDTPGAGDIERRRAPDCMSGGSNGSGGAPSAPLPCASAVTSACGATLSLLELVRLPPRNTCLQAAMGGGEPGGGGEQVLTALELARQARIAANRAFLSGLGLTPQSMRGQVRRRC